MLQLFGGALTRSGSFVHIAVLRIVQPAGFITAALFMVPGGLPVAFTIGVACAAICGLVFSWRQLVSPAVCRTGQVLAKYREFPIISLPVAVLNTFALAMPLLFIGQHYGEAAAGNYSQVQRLVAAPLLLCSAAVAQVFYKHAGDVARKGQSIRPLMWKTVRNLALVGTALLALVAVIGDPVLSMFLGSGWQTDSDYLLLILIPIVVRSSVSPITSVILLTGRLRLGAAWQIFYAVSSWILLSYMSTHFPLETLLLGVLVNEIVMYLIYLWVADVSVRHLEK
jgi:O-antigen/teichoic acid export membrane protein